ncbi:rhombosortase [Aliidiomarina taiwanensis]|uniref:Rhombosortase n=1 Tax=Aliidiomarina taiwanensis TaxID=946228 RepID=A0A432X9G7_9GAMM|nr:rhombosortase [Aliidiomarina taiwanensis]RUO44062.1 rhombosortase [Aliidiomarina taiwanensis]
MDRVFKYPVITPLLVLCVLLLVAYSPAAQDALVLIEGELWSQIWRLFGTHLVHIHLAHAIYNGLGLFLLAAVFHTQFTNRLLFNVMLLSALGGTLVSVYLGGESNFVGLSGVLHGVYAYAALRIVQTERTKGTILLALLVLKLSYDFVTAGSQLAWLDGAAVAHWCHFGGAIGGALAVPVLRKTSLELLRGADEQH